MNTNLVVALFIAFFSVNFVFAANIAPRSVIAASPKISGEKIAGSFSHCQIVPGVPIDGSKLDQFDTGHRSYDLLPKQIVDRLAPGADGREFNGEITPKIYQQAMHGVIDDYSFGYIPAPGFEGIDTASFIFEFEGKNYLIVHKFIVSIPKNGKALPYDCKEAWKLPKPQKHSLQQNGIDLTDSFSNWSDVLRMGELPALLSAPSSVSYTFSDLYGSSVSETTGEGPTAEITLDTHAAGNG